MCNKLKILTVDLEDWFHILDNTETQSECHWNRFPSRVEQATEKLLDLFDQHKQHATFFILGYIARKHPEIVSEIAIRGHEIATHGDMHQLAFRQTPDQFEADLISSLESITKAAGVMPRAYRAPGFSITSESTWVFDILVRNGIEVDASIFPVSRAHGGLPGFPYSEPCIIETKSGHNLRSFPMSVTKILRKDFVFSGGGYFRVVPDPVLQVLFAQNAYTMTYFHPRDFDPLQPIVPGLGLLRRFKSYYGLRTAYSKLDRLLSKQAFVDLREAELRVNWDRSKIVKNWELNHT
jgi:polysaccharide deacetylase family protein (PEP-CTERM system associated)